jgi:hypothetical protein
VGIVLFSGESKEALDNVVDFRDDGRLDVGRRKTVVDLRQDLSIVLDEERDLLSLGRPAGEELEET